MDDAITLFTRLKRKYVLTGQDSEWARLYSALFEIPDAAYTTFIKLGYFRNCRKPVQRFQEIPAEYKLSRSTPVKLFVSHKWEDRIHPDSSMRTLQRLLSLTQNADDDTGVWWDYCSLPQRNSSGEEDRSVELKEFFKFQLSMIPVVILDSQCMFLWSDEGLNSGWCCIELLVAQALLQHLNKIIYARKGDLKQPPLLVTQVANETRIETDLVRFEHKVFQKMFCTQTAMDRHRQLLEWMNEQVNSGAPTPYTQLIGKVTPSVISRMFSEQRMSFTNGSDREVVSSMLDAIYGRLNFEPFTSFKWTGQQDFFSMWHYVRGSLGSCLVPHVAYAF